MTTTVSQTTFADNTENTKNTTPEKTGTKYIYGYDDDGVKCRHSEEDGWEALEEHCINCGKRAGSWWLGEEIGRTECCDCGDYQC